MMGAPSFADPTSTEPRPLVEAIPEQAWTATPDGTLDYINRRVT
jgi:hypothetical protein